MGSRKVCTVDGMKLTMLLTVKELAIRLHVKEKTIYAWASQGKIPAVKINGVIRFDAQEINAWLQKCQVLVGAPAQHRRPGSAETRNDVDSLIESAKRAVYTTRGEARPIASPHGKETRDGAR